MENRSYALFTGLFILLLTAAMIVAGQRLGGDHRERTAYRVVSLQPVTGLNVQASVRYRGMGVGRVTAIELDPADARRILIDVEVNSDIPVRKSTYAQLGMEGITGVAYVHLLDDAATGGERLPEGAEIRTQPSFMDTLTDGAQDLTQQSRELVANLNRLLVPENRERLGRTLGSLEQVAANLEKASSRLPASLERIEGRIDAWLSEEQRQLARQSLQRLDQAASALPELVNEARQLAQDTRTLVNRLQALPAEAQASAAAVRETTLPQVGAVAEAMERSAGRIGRLADELEREPQSVLLGRRAPRPGPGEAGFQP